jgi:hypothetical protein
MAMQPFSTVGTVGQKKIQLTTRSSCRISVGCRRLVACGVIAMALALVSCGRRMVDTDTRESADTPAPAPTAPAAVAETDPPAAPAIAPPPQDQLSQAFARSGRLVFEAVRPAEFAAFQPLNQTSFTPGPGGLVITATGTDPQILLPVLGDCDRCALQVVITSPFPTVVELFHSFRDDPGFRAEQSQLIPVPAGESTIYFQADHLHAIDALRLDPGTKPGVYVIKSLIVRNVAEQ